MQKSIEIKYFILKNVDLAIGDDFNKLIFRIYRNIMVNTGNIFGYLTNIFPYQVLNFYISPIFVFLF